MSTNGGLRFDIVYVTHVINPGGNLEQRALRLPTQRSKRGRLVQRLLKCESNAPSVPFVHMDIHIHGYSFSFTWTRASIGSTEGRPHFKRTLGRKRNTLAQEMFVQSKNTRNFPQHQQVYSIYEVSHQSSFYSRKSLHSRKFPMFCLHSISSSTL